MKENIYVTLQRDFKTKWNITNFHVLSLGPELLDTILSVYDKLPKDFTVFVSGTMGKSLPDRTLSFDFLMTRSLQIPVCQVAREKVTLQSPLCYIYTSGTTGYLHMNTFK